MYVLYVILYQLVKFRAMCLPTIYLKEYHLIRKLRGNPYLRNFLSTQKPKTRTKGDNNNNNMNIIFYYDFFNFLLLFAFSRIA
jgi:hypothetical protein